MTAGARRRLESAAARPLGLSVQRLDLPGADMPLWETFFAHHDGRPLRELPFFEWEAWLYAWLLVETDYCLDGGDPFLPEKLRELATSLPSMERASREALDRAPAELGLAPALLRSLLANLADSSNPDLLGGGPSAILYADPWERIERVLLSSSTVVILADNAMSELWYDLLLARALRRARPDARITLVLKSHPMFVSDATIADLDLLWEAIEGAQAPALAAAALEVRALIQRDAIGITSWPELNAPLHFSAPEFAPRLLLDRPYLLKGDANFRRALEDRAWAPPTPLAEACRAPLRRAVFLRVLKSECVAGLPPSVLDVQHAVPEWRVNGRFATAQVLERERG